MVKLIKYIIQEVSMSDNFYVKGKCFKDAILEAYKKCEEKCLEDEKFSITKHGYIFTTDSGHYGRFIYEVDRGFSTVNILKYGYADVKSDLFPKVPGPVRKSKKSLDRLWIEDAWIPKTCMDEVNYLSHEALYAVSNDFPKNSIFLLKVKNNFENVLARRYAYNPKTKILLVSRIYITDEVFKSLIIDEWENPLEDFVFFKTGAIRNKNHGGIGFLGLDIKDMKNKGTSAKIVDTINMLKKNNINNESSIIFSSGSSYTLKYFLKTKVIW